MRVVLDTNVLVSGLLWRGPPHQLIEEARAGRFTIVTYARLLGEFAEVIRRRKLRSALSRSETSVDRLLREIEGLTEVVASVPALEPVGRDPDDDLVLAVAITARADLIVSGDADLLTLHRFRGIPILNPANALARLKG